MERMTIYEIKRRTSETNPHYFDRKTMKFFGQTLRDFSVTKREETMNEYSIERTGSEEKSRRIVEYCKNRLTKTIRSKYTNFWFCVCYDLIDGKFTRKPGAMPKKGNEL